jgi:hypothetical protein
MMLDIVATLFGFAMILMVCLDVRNHRAERKRHQERRAKWVLENTPYEVGWCHTCQSCPCRCSGYGDDEDMYG